MTPSLLQTERLLLRHWSPEDLIPFAALNADPRVMEHFPSVKSFEESEQEYTRIQEHFKKFGWGFWAVSLKGSRDFIGFIGLRYADFLAPFTPAVEVGWRLAFDYWGKGYAPEGARAALQYGFEMLSLKEIISYTDEHNMRSRRVMEKLRMHRTPQDDFDYHLKHHVLYRLTKEEWKTSLEKAL